MKKIIFMILGFLTFGLAAVGCIIPILPTVPFLILSSLCFMQTSEKINNWFQSTKIYKKHFLPYKEQKGMTLKTKLLIIIPVYIILLSLFILKDILAMRIVIAVVLIAKTLVFIKIKTIKQEKKESKNTIQAEQ
ncbi:MAG: YbaN family protein [Clostridia bacterium]|nr:YbaN family protein [Clostridia bacterium]MDD3963117.1 YbaN family protein [Synergistaceae bacterium]MDD4542752.1 YbaN family protein [Clostridia bacterium]HXK72250.1 YbaN family protein [Clostridia bacterium]